MENGEPDVVKAVNAEVKVLDDAKSAEVIFKEGVPQELFDDNNYLKITYPLDENGTTTLLPYQLDFNKEAEKISVNVKKAYISITDTVYEFDYANTVFNKPLVFDAYRSIDIIDEKPLRSVASNKIELPEEIKLTQEEVSSLVPAQEEVYEQDGIQVTYHCEFDLHIDQAAAGEDIGK